MLRAIIDRMMLTWRMLRDPRVPLWAKIIPVAAAIYVLSPLDLIPDVLIGLGQLDDLGVLIGAMRLFEAVVPGYIVDEHRIAILDEGGRALADGDLGGGVALFFVAEGVLGDIAVDQSAGRQQVPAEIGDQVGAGSDVAADGHLGHAEQRGRVPQV